MKKRLEVTDAQWELVRPLFTWNMKAGQHRGRPPRDARQMRNGMLWILRTGARPAGIKRNEVIGE